MRIRNLEVGLDSISHRQASDEELWPTHGKSAPDFNSHHQELDKILCRLSLDQKLTDMLQPASLDPELLEPTLLAASRAGAQRSLQTAAEAASGLERAALQDAADIVAQEVRLDKEVRAALASLMKG